MLAGYRESQSFLVRECEFPPQRTQPPRPSAPRSFRYLLAVRLGSLLVGVALAGVGQEPAIVQAAPINQAKVIQILDGNQVFIQEQRARVNDLARRGERVRTGQSRAQLEFNNGAVARLANRSVLVVGQCAQLKQGTLLVNGSMNGCSASVVAGVRGTTYVMEVNEQGDTAIKVLEGEVVLQPPGSMPEESRLPVRQAGTPSQNLGSGSEGHFSYTKRMKNEPFHPALKHALVAENPVPLRPRPELLPQLFGLSQVPTVPSPQPAGFPSDATQPPAPGTREAVLQAGDKLTISPEGEFGAIEQLTQEEFTSLLTGVLFSDFTTQLPGISKIQSSFESLFPGVPFPVNLPSLPGIPRPRLPGLPF